jgi:hypothetical protein
MKYFHCEGCGLKVFFENNRCVNCGHALGFLPDVLALSALEAAGGNLWRGCAPGATGRTYRQCANGQQHKVCNWMVPENDPNPLCVACRLNNVIPDLTTDKNIERWKKLELAKRRCVYLFLKLGLPLEGVVASNQAGLRFCFLEDTGNATVKTGHEQGVITVNVAEADDDEREHRRLILHEPYRTLVGHLRHESGHFYWDQLIANSPNLPRFRELFGDETMNYDAALQAYYQKGPPADWPGRTVTAYASSHPWEDWAETWAHYLHILDTWETAASFGVSVNPDNAANNSSDIAPIKFKEHMDLERLLTDWVPLICALNSFNRGMGLSDLYPFTISPAVTEKLGFIHSVIQSWQSSPSETGNSAKHKEIINH